MQGGDLSNETPPRVLVLFEGLVGTLPDGKTKGLHALDVRRRRWDKAASRWEVNNAVVGTVWRMDCRVELVTFRPEEETDALHRRLESGFWPFAAFWHTTVPDLADTLVYRPDIISVIHGDGRLWASFGAKGRVVSPARPDDIMRVA